MEGNDQSQVKMEVGQYEGTPVAQLPVSYCRWILNQDFPEEIMLAAKRKVDASPMCNDRLNVTRHAIDRFSIRFIDVWMDRYTLNDRKITSMGISTFLVKLAGDAWEHGEDISKHRHKDDGIVKEHGGIKYVFNQSKRFPEYKDLITVM